MGKWVQRLSAVLIASIFTAMVWPLTETQKLIEASPIKNWTSNEQITYTDLNNNFNHLHANLGHGHGPIITANDIASNAGIRPEQTTFGSTASRGLVFVGTFTVNPDGGTAYVPVNKSGTLNVGVNVRIAGNGFDVVAAGSGTMTDGGTNPYTVFAQAKGIGTTASGICYSLDSPTGGSLSTTIDDSYICYEAASWNAAPVETYPQGVSVQVYYNGVWP